jgi:ABC-type branched-subunit amino acid transport system permease subunit
MAFDYFKRLNVPDDFGFIPSIGVHSMAAVGGIGSVYGVIRGTALLTLMPYFQLYQRTDWIMKNKGN